MSKTNYAIQLTHILAYATQNQPKLLYHGPEHIEDVYQRVTYLARLEHIEARDTVYVQTAAALHDIEPYSEELSAKRAYTLLPQFHYTLQDIVATGKLILATKVSHAPENKLEMILKDADTDNLGRSDFFQKTEALRMELGVYDKKAWYEQTLKFMENHVFYTATAQRERNEGKMANMNLLKTMLKEVYLC